VLWWWCGVERPWPQVGDKGAKTQRGEEKRTHL